MIEVLHASVIVLAVTHVATLGLLAADLRRIRPMGTTAAVPLGIGAAALGATVASMYVPMWPAAVAGALCIAFFVSYVAVRRHELRPAGVAAWSSLILMTVAASAWGVRFVATMPVSTWTHALTWAALALVALSAPAAFIQIREAWEPLMRTRWQRSPDLDPAALGSFPVVSIHVPCHAEPPELVIGTLDHLARLDYPAFEVLVIDNNTTDPDLWRPVEAHCTALGPRFRFLHVEGISGAKAGALDWAAPHTDPEATLVGVVDADYHVQPDWLRRTVSHFADPTVGFVQCPHAYRDYEASRFCRMANWEYAVFFTTGMVSLDHHGAGLTVGTMSLIRRAALEAAGGWAEWCLTEDSELSIRIHALGYRSVYLNEPLGRGLIPETFAGYRQQRFRWTYGPVQELRRHLRLFLPRPLARPSELDWRQRVHHANHGLDVALVGVRTLAVPLGALAGLSMIVRHEVVKLPFELWLASTAILIGSVAVRWLTYRHLLKATLRQALGGALAYLALTHVITTASLTAVAGRDVPWRRTNKTKPRSQGWAALHAVRTELALGLACATTAALMLVVNRNGGVATMLAIGLAVQGVTYLAAPIVALIAEHELRHHVGDLIESGTDGDAAVVVPGGVAGRGGPARWFSPTGARPSDPHQLEARQTTSNGSPSRSSARRPRPITNPDTGRRLPVPIPEGVLSRMSRWRRRLVVAAVVVLAVMPTAAAAAQAAEGSRPGDPALSVDPAAVRGATACRGPAGGGGRDPVLLVHGTLITGAQAFGWNYLPDLAARGYRVCTVDLPNRSLGDIQISAEYVVVAVHQLARETGRKVDILAHSQGALEAHSGDLKRRRLIPRERQCPE